MKIHFKRIDHLQICIPIGKEAEARAFYCGLLGLEEIEKPEYLKKNGGFWLNIADIQLHIGAENLENHSKRHPAFEVENWQAVKQFLKDRRVKLKEDPPIPHFNRFSLYDPFNNRIEILGRIQDISTPTHLLAYL